MFDFIYSVGEAEYACLGNSCCSAFLYAYDNKDCSMDNRPLLFSNYPLLLAVTGIFCLPGDERIYVQGNGRIDIVFGDIIVF